MVIVIAFLVFMSVAVLVGLALLSDISDTSKQTLAVQNQILAELTGTTPSSADALKFSIGQPIKQ